MELPEISDTIVDFDPDTLARLPVRKADVAQRFRAGGNARAARIVESIPDRDGILDPEAVDRLLIRVHCEMQRLSEEFFHGARVAALLRPLLDRLRAAGAPRPLRIVDVGCGTGFVIRWLAAEGKLGEDVDLVGADYNAALIGEARRLAALERLPATFVVANAFRLAQPGTIFISTGVIHHFRGEGLVRFFASHEVPSARAFVHYDFQPNFLAPFGSWLFHVIRMREPLSLHDGVLSAARAHTGAQLLEAAQEGAPGFKASIVNARIGGVFPRVFHALVGVRA